VSVEAGPPQQPPQLSPDGKWVWDGSTWRPIAGVAEPAHMGVFAAYTSIEVPEEPVAVAVQPMPVQVRTPVIDYSYTPPEVADPEAPLWNQPARSGITMYLYVGGAVVVLVVAMMILNSMNFIQLPFFATRSQPSPVAVATPSLSATTYPRSESGRADQFLNATIAPAVDSFNQTLPAMLACNGVMSNSCFDAINISEPQMKNLLSAIDHAAIPPCIAPAMKNYRSDLGVMEAGLQLALKGYKDNQRGEVIDGLYRFNHYAVPLPALLRSAVSAQQTVCTTDQEGP
jgi:hypothetical protein